MTDVVDKIARAVLYEGYLLYPYRHSAIKNRQRWNFGVLLPPAWTAAETGSDRSYFRMECIAQGSREAQIEISIRFLQLVTRYSGDRSWQEAVEQRIEIPPISCAQLTGTAFEHTYAFSAGAESVTARLNVSITTLRDDILRVTLQLHNATSCQPPTREEALLYSLASAHAVLHLCDGQFISNTDPPQAFTDFVAGCQNIGVWPVLLGDSSSNDTILGSPIILYDYPQIAPESKGDLFDGTEIDEILMLRVLTLSEEEKQEIRSSDSRVRELLERVESTPSEHLLQLHGTFRDIQQKQDSAWSAWDTLETGPTATAIVNGTELKKGDRVRLRPRNRADVFDTILEGKTAIIEAVEQDFENRVHVAVVVEDDPGRDLGEMRQAAHRFFFSADEVELLASGGIMQ